MLALALRNKTEQVHRAATQASVEMTKLSGEAIEHLQNLKAVKAYAAQNRDIAMFSRSIMKASGSLIDTQKHAAATSFWWEGGSLMMMLAILYFALTFHSSSPAIAFLLLAVFARMVPKLSALNASLQSVIGNLPAHTRMEAAIAELTAAAESIESPNVQLSLRKSLTFENVSFRFSPHGRKILDEISLTIPVGQIVGIVGPSGAGKSTLADIVMGLLNPSSGRIMLDETELSPSLVHAWRTNIGYVAQDTVLFHDSVRANLLWAKPDATEDEMHEALSLTAAKFVMQSSNGLETVVGERGMLLSHGERQRLALARAMLRKPSMLILDEATNNLDGESERRVMESVVRLRKSVTILIIAHRLSTIRAADVIYVLESGQVVEQGTWEALMNRGGGRFRELYEVQNETFPSR
ncbi:MAG: ATP-binding cassette domain-containing protein [Terracidiphilus sp.]